MQFVQRLINDRDDVTWDAGAIAAAGKGLAQSFGQVGGLDCCRRQHRSRRIHHRGTSRQEFPVAEGERGIAAASA